MPPLDAPSRLEKLLGFLDHDPNNETLLRDAIETAVNERNPLAALNLIGRLPDALRQTPAFLSLAALATMQSGNHGEAAQSFEALLENNNADTGLRFNAAYARALTKDFDRALNWLDEPTRAALPQAAALYVRILHQNQEIDKAWDEARRLIAHHPDHPGLLAAASVLAIDLEDYEQAKIFAERAGGHPDALTTQGALALDEGRNVEALSLFERVLAVNSEKPRALIGRGLARLLAGEHEAAAEDLESGAKIFASHSGSWIAAGWAHLIANRLSRAREAFENAAACDRNFSEAHGSLAVLHILEGAIEEGRESAKTALRLDPQSFSGAFAQSLLLSGAGKTDQARAIIQKALITPIDERGKTIADALVRFGLTQ